MHHLRKSSGASQGNSQWILWGAHRHQGFGWKGNKAGFYWPTINIDAKALVRQCEACQKTANQQNLPSMPVHLIHQLGLCKGGEWT
jgi:hypothetical protein